MGTSAAGHRAHRASKSLAARGRPLHAPPAITPARWAIVTPHAPRQPLTTSNQRPCNRLTCALNTLRATRDLRKVALWLGHASTQTTDHYLQADPTEKLEALNALKPPALRPGKFRPPDRLIAALRPMVMRSAEEACR